MHEATTTARHHAAESWRRTPTEERCAQNLRLDGATTIELSTPQSAGGGLGLSRLPEYSPEATQIPTDALPDRQGPAALLYTSGCEALAAPMVAVTTEAGPRGARAPERGALAQREALDPAVEEDRTATSPFTFIDLFAGIGGMRKAFEPLGGSCVFTSEWNRFAQETYRANYACDHEIRGDITKVATEEIPPHDLLLAGFPCQPFSIAGVSKKNALKRPHGFRCEAQGTLFFDIARIIESHRPKAFLLENVKNLVSHDRGRTFRVIKRTLKEELGYFLDWRILDARHWVPQHRERIFIAGFREPTDFSFEDLEMPDGGPVLSSVLHPEDGTEPAELPWTEGTDAAVSARYTLSDRLWTYLQAYARKHRAAGNGFGFGLVGPDDVARTLSARYFKDGSPDASRGA